MVKKENATKFSLKQYLTLDILYTCFIYYIFLKEYGTLLQENKYLRCNVLLYKILGIWHHTSFRCINYMSVFTIQYLILYRQTVVKSNNL